MNNKLLPMVILSCLLGISTLRAQAHAARQDVKAPPEKIDVEARQAKIDELDVLKQRIERLAKQIEEMKKADAEWKAELEKKMVALAFRATALELAENKSGADFKQFQQVFAGHTHAMPNIGVISASSLNGSGQIGVLWVPTVGNMSVDLSRTGKPSTTP